MQAAARDRGGKWDVRARFREPLRCRAATELSSGRLNSVAPEVSRRRFLSGCCRGGRCPRGSISCGSLNQDRSSETTVRVASADATTLAVPHKRGEGLRLLTSMLSTYPSLDSRPHCRVADVRRGRATASCIIGVVGCSTSVGCGVMLHANFNMIAKLAAEVLPTQQACGWRWSHVATHSALAGSPGVYRRATHWRLGQESA